ncbi:putative bacteriophage transcriptional regulator [Pasteurella multocida subsp. multocida OH4807]|nr:putative bacteriophage transcriptional regulator [Pasteurella multocida subsp. multocida OH4807]
MQNFQEWFSIKELMDKELYLPSSDKGIVKKAAREGWIKRQREGVKGKTFEYHYSSFPVAVQKQLGLYDENNPRHSLHPDQINERVNTYSTQFPLSKMQGNDIQAQIPFYHHFTLDSIQNRPDDYIGLSLNWLKIRGIEPEKLLFMVARGDAMHPTIQRGDILLVNRAVTTPKDGEIYLMRNDTQIWVKRIQGLPNGLRLISDNQLIYPQIDLEFDKNKYIEVIGRVIFIGHDLI